MAMIKEKFDSLLELLCNSPYDTLHSFHRQTSLKLSEQSTPSECVCLWLHWQRLRPSAGLNKDIDQRNTSVSVSVKKRNAPPVHITPDQCLSQFPYGFFDALERRSEVNNSSASETEPRLRRWWRETAFSLNKQYAWLNSSKFPNF